MRTEESEEDKRQGTVNERAFHESYVAEGMSESGDDATFRLEPDGG